MRSRKLAHSLLIASATLALVACDPKAPVETNDAGANVDDAIAVHAADAGTHQNLALPVGNLVGQITSGQVLDGTITGNDLAAGAVSGTHLASGAVGPQAMAVNAVDTGTIADLAVTTAKIADTAVDGTKIANDAINSARILDASIALGDMALDSVDGAKIVNMSVDTADLNDNAVATAKIANDAVTSAKILNGEVQTADIAAAAVTSAKLAAGAVTQDKLASDFAQTYLDATTGAFTTIFTFDEPNGGAAVAITLVGACESDVANSMVRLRDGNENVTFNCPDTNLNGPPQLFSLTVTASNEDVFFEVDAGMNNSNIRWRIYGITFQ